MTNFSYSETKRGYIFLMTNFLTTLLDVITNNGTTEGWYWCSIREDKDIQLQGTYVSSSTPPNHVRFADGAWCGFAEIHLGWIQQGAWKSNSLTEVEGGGAEGGVEGGGGIEGGDTEVGQPDGTQKNFTVVRVSRRRGYSLYTRYIIGIDWHNSADTKYFIYGIGWRKPADTNKARLINTHHCPDRAHSGGGYCFDRENCSDQDYSPFWGIFSTFSNMCLPLFCHVIYRFWF
jgi:hypothetical protein